MHYFLLQRIRRLSCLYHRFNLKTKFTAKDWPTFRNRIMNRFWTILPAVLFALLSAGVIQAQTEQASIEAQEKIVERKLETVATLDFEDTEFSSVVDFLDKKHDLKVQLHQSAIDAGLGMDDLVTMNFNATRLSTALDMFLEKYDATFTIKDNCLILLSTDEAQNHLRIKVYDCRKLLAEIKPRKQPVSAGFGGGGFPGTLSPGKSGGVFNVKQDDQKKEEQPKKAEQTQPQTNQVNGPNQTKTPPKHPELRTYTPSEQLIDLIIESVDPDHWEENGGMGTIREINGIVVVAQTESTHRKVNRLLDSLEKLIVEK